MNISKIPALKATVLIAAMLGFLFFVENASPVVMDVFTYFLMGAVLTTLWIVVYLVMDEKEDGA